MTGFTSADAAAFLWFAICWAGYTVCADHSPWRRHSITTAMNQERRAWMDQMMARELRMLDTQILGNLLRSLGFFASTTILVVAGLIAVLGAAEQAIETLAELPFAVPSIKAVWHAKVLLLIVIFVYAFFKFAWSYRLFNYLAIMIGAAPPHTQKDSEAARIFAHRGARLCEDAGRQFNRGQRAFFFALGYLGWFLGPIELALTTVGVVIVMWRRQFASNSRRAFDAT